MEEEVPFSPHAKKAKDDSKSCPRCAAMHYKSSYEWCLTCKVGLCPNCIAVPGRLGPLCRNCWPRSLLYQDMRYSSREWGREEVTYLLFYIPPHYLPVNWKSNE